MEKVKWVKGQSGNPLGGKTHSPELKRLKNLTETEMVEIGSLVVKGSIEELREIIRDPTSTALKAMMASVAIKAIAKGDAQALDILLNRLVGKAKERVEVTSNNTTKTTGIHAIVLDDELRARLAKIRSDI